MTEKETDFFFTPCKNHPIQWRLENSAPPQALQLVSSEEPPDLEPTKFIKILKGKRADGRWSLLFQLNDSEYANIFSSFCSDLIEHSHNIDPKLSFEYATNRYKLWRELFKNPPGELNSSEIQGLIGELIALRDLLIPKYGETIALNAWMNAKLGKQDFICPDKWYEIKTTNIGKQTITISSLDQLDRDDEGELILITLRKTSIESPSKVIINSLCNEINNNMSKSISKRLFTEILRITGYTNNPKYDEYAYEIVKFEEYYIDTEFPSLRRSKINQPGIWDAEYEINIDSIKEHKV